MSRNTIRIALLSTGILLTALGCSEATETQDAAGDASPAATRVAQADNAGDAKTAQAEPAAAAAPVAAGEPKTLQEAMKADFGTLKNPYTDNAQAIKEGEKLYLGVSCNGCHGGGGGGGMCPPLTNETFVYGSDDDVMFRLIALGSDGLMEKHGLKRVGQETVVGPMPGFEDIIKTDQDLWKIIAFVRSKFKGRAKKRNW